MEFLKRPPYTEKELEELKKYHECFFGICYFCKAAGHVDQIVELSNGEYVDVCDDCRGKSE